MDSKAIGNLKEYYLLDFLGLFIKEAKGGLHNLSKSTIKNYSSAYTRIEEYCQAKELPGLAFDRVDMNWYRNYFLWMQENKYGHHGFDNHIKIVKRIMREARKRNLHNNLIWQNRGFKPMKKGFADKIYLSPDDIKKLEYLDLSTIPHLERERDRFLISFYFIMRWEDSTLINKQSVIDNCGLNYAYTSKKTGIKCIIPISGKARRILEKYDYQFGRDTNQKSNEKIKEIGAMVGINNIIRQASTSTAKYKFINTHTARRSAATNLYMEGMDLETIARVGGWKKLETLKVYLRASGMDVVQMTREYCIHCVKIFYSIYGCIAQVVSIKHRKKKSGKTTPIRDYQTLHTLLGKTPNFCLKLLVK